MIPKPLYTLLTVLVFLAIVFGGHFLMVKLPLPWWGFDIGQFLIFSFGLVFVLFSWLLWEMRMSPSRSRRR